jgi:hypothetical protein
MVCNEVPWMHAGPPGDHLLVVVEISESLSIFNRAVAHSNDSTASSEHRISRFFIANGTSDVNEDLESGRVVKQHEQAISVAIL